MRYCGAFFQTCRFLLLRLRTHRTFTGRQGFTPQSFDCGTFYCLASNAPHVYTPGRLAHPAPLLTVHAARALHAFWCMARRGAVPDKQLSYTLKFYKRFDEIIFRSIRNSMMFSAYCIKSKVVQEYINRNAAQYKSTYKMTKEWLYENKKIQ